MKIYLPYIANNSGGSQDKIVPQKRGIALTHNCVEDVSSLNCSWFYNWDNSPEFQSDPRYVPMSWAGQMIETNKRDILFLNEPDISVQSNKTPYEAAILYKDFLDKYGVDSIIFGGMTAPGQIYTNNIWIITFLNQCLELKIPVPTRWHLHGYIEPLAGIDVLDIINWWKDVHSLLKTDIWITEWGDPSGNVDTFSSLLKFMEETDWIVRYSPFGVRLSGSESWYPSRWGIPPKINLIDANGNLTELGNLYKGQI